MKVFLERSTREIMLASLLLSEIYVFQPLGAVSNLFF